MVIAAVSTASSAWAEAATRLVYTRDRAAAVCPDEATLREAVRDRLGYDPFDASAASAVTFAVRPAGRAFVVRIERTDDDSTSLGVRELRSRGETCDALVQAAALSLSIALDPVAASQPHSAPPPVVQASVDVPPAAPTSAPPPTPVLDLAPQQAPRDEAASPPPPPSEHLLTGWHLGAFGAGDWGIAPGAAAGFALHGGVEVRHGSLDLEARYEAPAGEAAAQGGSVQSWLVAGSLVPCARWSVLAVCGLVSLGRVQASSSGVTSPETKEAFFAGLGGRLGVELPVNQLLAFAVHGDLEGNVTRSTFQLDGTPAWRAPAILGGVGAGAVVHFR